MVAGAEDPAAREACRELVEHYAHLVEWIDGEGLAALFWEDVAANFGPAFCGGRDAFAAWVGALELAYARRQHRFGLPRFQVAGQVAGAVGRAEAGAFMFLRHTAEPVEELLFGRYFFRFARRQARWRIVSLAFRMHGLRRFPAAPEDPALAWAEALEAPQPLHWRLP